MDLAEAKTITGPLGKPSKMPGYSYGLPAGKAEWVKKEHKGKPLSYGCPIGKKLMDVPGTVCHKCYATKGNYLFPNVKQAQLKRLKGLQSPYWAKAMAMVINASVNPLDPYFRWHDSGDLLNVEHLAKIVDVAYLTPNVHHWLPTREAGIVKSYWEQYGQFPPNLVVRVSSHNIDSPPLQGYNLTSTVWDKYAPIGHDCPARLQGNKCGSCRACWQRNVSNVSYHKH